MSFDELLTLLGLGGLSYSEMIWVMMLIETMGFTVKKPMLIFEDNQGTFE